MSGEMSLEPILAEALSSIPEDPKTNRGFLSGGEGGDCGRGLLLLVGGGWVGLRIVGGGEGDGCEFSDEKWPISAKTPVIDPITAAIPVRMPGIFVQKDGL